MRLSEAIFLGSKLNPQARGKFKTDSGATCAWGAAFDAIGISAQGPEFPRILPSEWDWTTKGGSSYNDPIGAVNCIDCHEDYNHKCNYNLKYNPQIGMSVRSFIAHLNDEHNLTREQIADYVASIEPKELVAVESTIEQSEEVCV